MKDIYLIAILFSLLLFTMACTKSQADTADSFETEKQAIITVLNGETKAAFNRDYPAWEDHWIQESYVTKTYMNFADSSMSESLGWEEISDFVRTYIEEHPEPAPLPELLDEIDLRLYKNGAWVTYMQNDPIIGLKRETRFMEKEDGQWKIASMQTVIYGFNQNTSN